MKPLLTFAAGVALLAAILMAVSGDATAPETALPEPVYIWERSSNSDLQLEDRVPLTEPPTSGAIVHPMPGYVAPPVPDHGAEIVMLVIDPTIKWEEVDVWQMFDETLWGGLCEDDERLPYIANEDTFYLWFADATAAAARELERDPAALEMLAHQIQSYRMEASRHAHELNRPCKPDECSGDTDPVVMRERARREQLDRDIRARCVWLRDFFCDSETQDPPPGGRGGTNE